MFGDTPYSDCGDSFVGNHLARGGASGGFFVVKFCGADIFVGGQLGVLRLDAEKRI